jgi:hypothetical protein
VQILETVQNKLYEEKRKLKKDLEALLEEEHLLDKHIADNEHKLKLARAIAENLNEKYIVVEKSLQPLVIEKEKAELFEVEKLISNK